MFVKGLWSDSKEIWRHGFQFSCIEVMVSCLPFARRDVSGLPEFTESPCLGLPATPAGEEKGEAHDGRHQPGSVMGAGEGTSGGGPSQPPALWIDISCPSQVVCISVNTLSNHDTASQKCSRALSRASTALRSLTQSEITETREQS